MITTVWLVCSLAVRAVDAAGADEKARAQEALALSAAADASLARGDYEAAIRCRSRPRSAMVRTRGGRVAAEVPRYRRFTSVKSR